MMSTTRRAVAVMGATATGKSDIAIRLAERFGGEIISIDSRQAYRGLDIGTGKVSVKDRRRVPHHLIDVLDPTEINSAGAHVERARRLFETLAARGIHVFFVGGTGLYFRVLFRGIIAAAPTESAKATLRRDLAALATEDLHRKLLALDPARARALSSRDRVRITRAIEIALLTGKTYTEHISTQGNPPAWDGLKLVLTLPRAALRERIALRTREMYDRGWIEEVRTLMARGIGIDAPAMGSLGYDVIARAIAAGEDPGVTLEKVITLTQQYAKRQETFFRGEADAIWVDVSKPGASSEIERLVAGHFGL